jgi:hypothetical protein
MVHPWDFACPKCMCEANAYRLKKGLKATWFDCHRRFLPIDHPFRNKANAFHKGRVVREGPPRNLTRVEVKDQLYSLVDNRDKYGKEHNWTYMHMCKRGILVVMQQKRILLLFKAWVLVVK